MASNKIFYAMDWAYSKIFGAPSITELEKNKWNYFYFRIDYNGNSGKRNLLGSNMPMIEEIVKLVYKDSIQYPDPGICIFSHDHQLVDKIYWKDNPKRILHYFSDFVL